MKRGSSFQGSNAVNAVKARLGWNASFLSCLLDYFDFLRLFKAVLRISERNIISSVLRLWPRTPNLALAGSGLLPSSLDS